MLFIDVINIYLYTFIYLITSNSCFVVWVICICGFKECRKNQDSVSEITFDENIYKFVLGSQSWSGHITKFCM